MNRFSILVLGLGFFLADACERTEKPGDITFVTIQMGDASYRVPFFKNDRTGKDLPEDNKLYVDIQIDWPDHRPRSRDEQRVNWVRYETDEMNLSVRNSKYASVSYKIERVEAWYDAWVEAPAAVELVEMVPSSPPNPDFFKPYHNEFADFHKYYKALSFGTASDFIECLNDKRNSAGATYRWCSHSFDARGFHWTIQYDVSHLEHWRLLRAQAIDRFDSWKVEPIQ